MADEAEIPVEGEVVEAAAEEYPGLEFTPPQGTVDDGAMEGEALVKWKKVGDKFTLVEFEGQPLVMAEAALEEETPTPDSIASELSAMDSKGM